MGMRAKRRQGPGRKKSDTCGAGHPLTGDNLKPRRGGGRECRECARLRRNPPAVAEPVPVDGGKTVGEIIEEHRETAELAWDLAWEGRPDTVVATVFRDGVIVDEARGTEAVEKLIAADMRDVPADPAYDEVPLSELPVPQRHIPLDPPPVESFSMQRSSPPAAVAAPNRRLPVSGRKGCPHGFMNPVVCPTCRSNR